MKQEPAFSPSKNIPIPDCPTPDSVHSGSESFASSSFPTPSPVLATQQDNTFNQFHGTSCNSGYGYSDHLNTEQNKTEYQIGHDSTKKNEDQISYPSTSSGECNNTYSSSKTNEEYNSPLFESILSKTSHHQHYPNLNTMSFYANEKPDSIGYLKTTSLRSKGKKYI